MKKVVGIILIMSVAWLHSCTKEGGITATHPPDLVFSSGESPFQEDSIIHAAAGKKFNVAAYLTDEVGLKSFNFYYPDWYLDNTINLTEFYPGKTLLEYDLSFNFTVPKDVDPEEEFSLGLTTTNLGGLSSERNVIVRLDGDYNAPVISNIEPGNNAILPSEGLRVKFRVQEDEKLKYVVFYFPGAAVYDSITSFRGGKAYSYDEAYDHLSEGKYSFTIKAVDMFENTREKSVAFIISN